MIVIVKLHIHSCFAGGSSRDVWMQRGIELPFPPILGMELSDGDWACEIKHIYYSVKEKICTAYAEPDKELYHRDLHKEAFDEKARERLIEKVLEELETGWFIDYAPNDIKMEVERRLNKMNGGNDHE